MKKTIKHAIAFALLVGFAMLALGSMGSSPNITNTYSSSSEQGIVYTFYNHSSYPVTIWDSTGSKIIEPQRSVQARFNSSASIYDVRYDPADKVICEQAGSGFFFRDR